MSKVPASAPVDPKSVDPDNTAAWDKAKKDAKEAGILWERPKDDKRSAKEILNDSDLLKNLGNQAGVRESLEKRVGGKIGEDADATFRAVQVLEHIERFKADGGTIVGGDLGNNEINGFKKSGQAVHGTEAGRLQDFGKYGFGHLKGELQHIELASEDPEARAKAEELGIEWERPEGDTRSAKEIIDDTPLLKNLGDKANLREMLKERVGDFENDADAAHRAAQVLEHVETYDSDGKRVASRDIGNGQINGFKGDNAVHGTEAGRLQDFGKYGFDNLEGEFRDSSKAGDNKDAMAKAETLGIFWVRPETDKRSAKDIVENNPTLKNLGNQSDVKDMLKEQVGDYEKDADAAFRAEQVVKHIETYDATGNSTGKKSDGKINGFDPEGRAKENTEAARLQDFGKYGFDALKGELTDEITPKHEEAVDQARVDAINKARDEAGLPPADKQDITQLMTSDKGQDGKALTVTESAWQKVMADWKTGIDNGSIKADDDRAKLYNAIKAGAFHDSGAQMYALSISEGVTTKAVTGKDMEHVIDGADVDKQIAELMKSDAVSKDITAARKDALTKVKDGDKIVDDLKKMATSEEYAKYIQELSGDPKTKQVAEDDIAATYTSLLAVDPDAAAKFAQNMQIDTMTMELDALMADPSKITNENLTLAGADTAKMLLTLIKKGALDLGRRAAEAQKFLEGMLGDKKTLTEFSKAMAELAHKFSETGEVSTKEVEKLIGGGKYKGLQEGGGRAFFEEMTKAGVIGSAGGLVSLASGIYQLAGKGGTLADTTEERLAIAKDFVSFVGAGKHFADLGNYIIGEHNSNVLKIHESIEKTYVVADDAPADRNRDLPIPDPDDVDAITPAPDPNQTGGGEGANTEPEDTRTKVTQEEYDRLVNEVHEKHKFKPSLLGLDRTLDDLLQSPSGVDKAPGPHTDSNEFFQAMDDALESSSSSEKYSERLDDFLGDEKAGDAGDKARNALAEGIETRPDITGIDANGNSKSASKLHKGASAFLLVSSAGADTFVGAADVAIGALTIKKGMASGDDVTISKGALQVAAGGFGLTGGVASSLGLLKGLQFVKAAAAPSFLVSAVLSIATVIPDIINDIKKTNQIETHRDDLRDFMLQLDEQGLLTKDGLDKFRFLDSYMSSYGQRDAPDGMSIFDYRDSEVDHFLNYWNGEDGKKADERGQFTSGFGLDEDHHKDYSGDGENLNSKMDD